MTQGTPEWFAKRLGKVTASRFKDVMAKTKSGPSASRQNYLAQLVCERMTGTREEGYTNAAMQWGTDHEPFARMALEARGVFVEEVDFIEHPWLLAGCSPDGLIDTDGMVEIKCPNTATHIDTLLKGMPPGHIPQVQGQLWIADRKWCDFVSYDPRLPDGMRLYVQRIERDDAYITTLAKEVVDFLGDIEKTIKDLEARYALPT